MWNIKTGIVRKVVPKQNTLSSLAIIATWEKLKNIVHKRKGLGALLPAVHAIPKERCSEHCSTGSSSSKENPTSLRFIVKQQVCFRKVCKNVIKKGLIKTILLILRMLLDSVLLFPLKHNLVL